MWRVYTDLVNTMRKGIRHKVSLMGPVPPQPEVSASRFVSIRLRPVSLPVSAASGSPEGVPAGACFLPDASAA